ncbi:MAG: hypothetical protein HW395_41 [candidate division NC10 bacterium]|nr:hypothetical protein [candidate division NC10 bacterium]
MDAVTRQSLTTKARRYTSPTTPSLEVVDLALAWARGEVRLVEVKHAVGNTSFGSTIYVQLARGLREALRQGRLLEIPGAPRA